MLDRREVFDCPGCKQQISTAIEYSELRGCYRPNGIEAHHIKPRRFGGNDAPENMIALCRPCHRKLHRLYVDRAVELARQADPAFFSTCLAEFVGVSVDA